MKKKVPDRWENYLPLGCRVPGTRFIPFKVPLKSELCRDQPESQQFTPSFLLESTPTLKAVIDLTNTDRYYNSEEFTNKGVLYRKVYVRGGGSLPSKQERREFFDAVDQLCETLGHDSDALIGVHCTHGLNRTGYLICKYMVSRMKIDPQEAINRFQEARGYRIERSNYVKDIMYQRQPRPRHSPAKNWRTQPRLSPSRRNWRLHSYSSASRYNDHGPRRRDIYDRQYHGNQVRQTYRTNYRSRDRNPENTYRSHSRSGRYNFT